MGWRGKKIISFGIFFKYSPNVWIFDTWSYTNYQDKETPKYTPIYIRRLSSIRKEKLFSKFFSSKLKIINDKVNWMLKDLDYGINLTLAEANISRQKSSILVLCKERRREEVLYRCRCSQTQHEHNIMEKQHQVDTEPPLIKTQPTHYWESCTQWLLPRKNKKSNSEYSVA